jgi:putative ABC transport system ATP-binding protein
MIELINISKIYGRGEGLVNALMDINLQIEDGKFISIVGKSGSGKSTMMNIIGALDKPTSGDVISNGKILSKMTDDELAEYRNKFIGYIFQSFYLEPTFTVLENVAMPLTISGMKKAEREELARKAIKQLDLEDKTNKKASELSGGQKQRVSIARAIVHNPDIILADEPTGNLDSHNGQEVIKLLQNISNSGKTVILVTHNIDDAYKTDKMVLLKDGYIQKIIENSEETKQQAVNNFSDYDAKGNLKNRNIQNL